MPAIAIEMAGGINVAQDAEPISEGSSIAAFGAERILELADQIDVYVSQRGAMNAGGNLHSITIRPGFNTIKAVQDGRVFLINEKIISSPTFRFYKGVKEIARYLYPELMDDLSTYRNENPATKRDFANILFRSMHLELYTTASSKYYQENHSGHIYGLFADVPWEDPDFDVVETAAMRSLVNWELENDRQYYRPDSPVTREELAKAIFMRYDFEAMDEVSKINDLAGCKNPKMVQALVDYGIFTLNDGNFEPAKTVTCKEIVETLESVKEFMKETVQS
jgi:iron complex transport system substrate-binding protein